MTKIKTLYLLIAIFFVCSFAGLATATTDDSVNINDLTRSMSLTSTYPSGDYEIDTYVTTDPEKINELFEEGLVELIDGEMPTEVTIVSVMEKESDPSRLFYATQNTSSVKNVRWQGRAMVTTPIKTVTGRGPGYLNAGNSAVLNNFMVGSLIRGVTYNDVSNAVKFPVNGRSTVYANTNNTVYYLYSGQTGVINVYGVYDMYSFDMNSSIVNNYGFSKPTEYKGSGTAYWGSSLIYIRSLKF